MTLNTAQRFTLKGLAVAVLLAATLVVGLLVLEGHAVAVGGNSTISELLWLVWAKQPWAILLLTHTLAAPFWFLAGHFFGQSSEVYDRIREGGLG